MRYRESFAFKAQNSVKSIMHDFSFVFCCNGEPVPTVDNDQNAHHRQATRFLRYFNRVVPYKI